MGFTFYDAIDDVWIKKNGSLFYILNVKSNSKNEFNWVKTWQNYEYPKRYQR